MSAILAAVSAATLMLSPASAGSPSVALAPAGSAVVAAEHGDVAVPPPDKAIVLARWTQPSAASYRLWDAAWRDQGRWQPYDFIWTSDLCTDGPDRPAGFDFRMSCRRHDFGYRNYQAAGTLAVNRARLDRTFHADLRRQCGTYRRAVRPICLGLAWTYFRATRHFGATVGQTRPILG